MAQLASVPRIFRPGLPRRSKMEQGPSGIVRDRTLFENASAPGPERVPGAPPAERRGPGGPASAASAGQCEANFFVDVVETSGSPFDAFAE